LGETGQMVAALRCDNESWTTATDSGHNVYKLCLSGSIAREIAVGES
jgi:hypothetical protein